MIEARPALRLAPVRIAAALCLVLPLAGCSSSVVKDSEAPGTYRADPDWGTSTLVLAKDHTFIQTVTVKGGGTQRLNGSWRIKLNGGAHPYTTINLWPYLNVTHNEKGSYRLAGAFSIYHVPFGGINIAADPDYGIAHRK